MTPKILEDALCELRFSKAPETLYAPIDYTLQLGGKRMRPTLTLLAYQLFRDDPETILRPAMATEVFHNFTLLHDDIMDNAPLRRGKPTAHTKWGTNTALLSGDVMLVKAYDLLLDVPETLLPAAIRYFNQCATEVCEGQQYDMSFEERQEVQLDQYLEMIRLKTAVLLGFALRLGGMLGGAPTEVHEQLNTLGEQAGIGFQLQDDLLDVYADPEKFGKQVGGDILENKKTFLLLTALERAEGETATALRRWLQTDDQPKEKVRAVRAIYDALGVREATTEKMKSYFSTAFETLAELPVEAERKQALHKLLQRLAEREF